MKLAARRAVLALALLAPSSGALCTPAAAPLQEGAAGWVVLHPTRQVSAGGAQLAPRADGAVLVSGALPEQDTYTLEFEVQLEQVTALRLEALPDESLPARGPGRSASGNFVLSELRLEAGSSNATSLSAERLVRAVADHSQDDWHVSGAVDGRPGTGWAIQPRAGQPSTAVFRFERPYLAPRGARLRVVLDFQFGQAHALGCFRLSAGAGPDAPEPEPAGDPWHAVQGRVNAAIDLGLEYLLATQELDGSWAEHQGRFRNGLTALCAYALIKSGLPADHQAVQRALEFLRCEAPHETYSRGCQLLLLAATEDPQHDPWMAEIAEELVDSQGAGFAYPWGGVDISNSQYGALGMWAAARHGVEVPRRAWEQLAQAALARQEQRTGSYEPAGFGYNSSAGPTGSRTAAGVAILAICAEQLGAERAQRIGLPVALARGLAWLDRHFSPTSNPMAEKDDAWLLYYLYGVERVGALTGRERLGGSDWYRDGARYLVRVQGADGHWDTKRSEPRTNTCFALLFLTRATAPSTGGSSSRKGRTYGGEDPERDVSLRAAGDTPIAVWVAGIGERVRVEALGLAADGPVTGVTRVEYLAQRVERLLGGPDQRWRWRRADPGAGWRAPEADLSRWKEHRGALRELALREMARRETGGDLWLRTRFELAPGAGQAPELAIELAPLVRADPAELGQSPLLCLYDEEPGFPALLTEASGSSRAEHRVGSAQNGRAALHVSPSQRHRVSIPGWRFPIRARPGPGEYRYLRFAWRKRGGRGIMLQLANGGKWGTRAWRYFAGENVTGFEPALQVARRVPEEWTVVTRDLYEDLGGEGLLTGVALSPMDGEEGAFDALYLARRKSDFASIPADGHNPGATAGPAALTARDGELGLAAYLNGELVCELEGPVRSLAPVDTGRPLEELLRPGTNVLALYVRGGSDPLRFDLELRSALLLAARRVDPERPFRGEEHAARASFPRPGAYVLSARVHLERDGVRDTIHSEPLTVRVENALDPVLIEYAGDAARNRLAGIEVQARASSELGGWPAGAVADGLQGGGWLCSDGDLSPTLELRFARGVRADTLLLSPARPDRRDPERDARATLVEVRVNGKGAHLVPLERDPERKTRWRLPRPTVVRELELRVLARSGSHLAKDAVGFAEVELQLGR